MRCLFLDLASHGACIACVSAEHTAVMQAVDRRIGDHELLPLIEQALKEAGWSYGDLTHIACVIGPGGFTSLRVGVTCANVLAHELKIPLAGVHLSEVYRARAGNSEFRIQNSELRNKSSEVIWVHSTKKEQLFVCGGPWKEPTLITLSELREQKSVGSGQWAGELIPEHRAVCEALGMQSAELQPLETVLPEFLQSCTYAENSLEPWYGRGW